MTATKPAKLSRYSIPAVLGAALLFTYFSVLSKLVFDWWTDENYSHGLLVPFVIGFIIWLERQKLRDASQGPSVGVGAAIVAVGLMFLAAGTLGSELFTQRISLVLVMAGVVVYFFGARVLSRLAVPFVLFLLAIPIPQIIFNRVAFPLQIFASKLAVWGIRLFEVPVLRNGNVMEILPKGATQTIALEVVEACSGIRSLSTLITLALVLAYFTRRDEGGGLTNFSRADLWRALILMIGAVPIAVLTNAARVAGTGILTYYYGRGAAEGLPHEVAGWLVYVAALAIMIAVNSILKKFFRDDPPDQRLPPVTRTNWRNAPFLPLLVVIVASGLVLTWFTTRGEVQMPRKMLAELPRTLGQWKQKGIDFPIDAQTLSILGASDYTMREYNQPDGRIANIYVGYYSSQRTGATYHSPLNCLPGAGWIMSDPGTIEITATDGRKFNANRYVIESGIYREVMIYWYQGRGRIEASEYNDKISTVWDSVARRRTDGAMVRVMTAAGDDEAAATQAAADLSARLQAELEPFIPE